MSFIAITKSLVLASLLIGLGPVGVSVRADDWRDEAREYRRELRKRDEDRARALRKRQREMRELARERERDRRRAVREWQEFQRDYWRGQERIARDRARALERWREVEPYGPAAPLYVPPARQEHFFRGPYRHPPNRFDGDYEMYESLPPLGDGYYEYELPRPYYDDAVPRYGRSTATGAQIGRQLGGLIGGAEGAAVGESIGAQIGGEVDRDRWERSRN